MTGLEGASELVNTNGLPNNKAINPALVTFKHFPSSCTNVW